MKNLLLKSLALAAGLAVAEAASAVDSWFWNGSTDVNDSGQKVSYGKAVQAAVNWANAATGEQGIPKDGDVAVFDTAHPYGNQTIGADVGTVAFGGLVYSNRTCNCNQGTVTLRAGGPGVQHLTSGNVYWNSGLALKGSGEVPVHVALAGSELQIQKNFSGDAGTVLVKSGPGTINVFCNGWHTRTFSVPKTLLREGTFRISQYEGNTSTGTEFWFDSDDPALRLSLFYKRDGDKDYPCERYNWVIKDGAIREGESVRNHYHDIYSVHTNLLVFTGTPKVNPMTFTGRLTGNAGLKWAPSAASEFVFSGGASTSCGKVIVNNGTVRLADGASFTSLASLQVVGDASVFAVDERSYCDFSGTAVTLSNGGRLNLAARAPLPAGSVTVDGETVAEGYYSGVASEGVTVVDWIVGAGVLRVGPLPAESATASWIATEGNVSDAANWEGGVTPDLNCGATKVVVASGVSGAATLSLDRGVWLSGIAARHKSWVTVAGENQLTLGGEGFVTAPGSRGVIDAPTVLTETQLWSVVSSGGFEVKKAVQSYPGIDLTVIGVNSQGWIDWDCACPDLRGGLTFTNMLVNLKGTATFGPAEAGPVYIYNNGKSPTFVSGLTIDRDLWITDISRTPGNGSSRITVPDGGTLTFNGAVCSTNTQALCLSLGKDSTVTFNKLFMSRHGGSIVGSGTAIFNGPYHNRDRFSMSGGTLEFHAKLNRMNGNMGDWYGGTVKLMTEYALEASNKTQRQPKAYKDNSPDYEIRTMVNPRANAVLDLCGNDQSVDHVAMHGGDGTVTSETAATLLVNRQAGYWAAHNYTCGFTPPSGYPKTEWYGYECADCGFWKGGVTLRYAGVTPEQRFMMRASTSTGCVEVVSGKLIFLRRAKTSGETFDLKLGSSNPYPRRTDESGSWLNASAVEVSGGELELEHGKVFGSQTDVRITGGTIRLDAGVRQKVKSLTIDGVTMTPGVYGSAESSAENKSASFAGPGVLKVGAVGTWVVVR